MTANVIKKKCDQEIGKYKTQITSAAALVDKAIAKDQPCWATVTTLLTKHRKLMDAFDNRMNEMILELDRNTYREVVEHVEAEHIELLIEHELKQTQGLRKIRDNQPDPVPDANAGGDGRAVDGAAAADDTFTMATNLKTHFSSRLETIMTSVRTCLLYTSPSPRDS